MKISLCLMAVFAVCCCVASMSVDTSSESTAFDGLEYNSDNTRTKRSGEIIQALLSKKLNLLGTLSGSSAGKSLGVPDASYGAQQLPLSFHTKSFSLWGVKKAIMASVFQAAKAITGGVLALKGQLIKAKGHVVQAKGKLLQTKGEAITNLGKNVATHAFDSGVHQQYDDQLAYIQPQLPVPTNYGGYQGVQQAYSQTAYAAPRPISYPATYGGQGEYSNDAGYANQGYTAKRAVSNPLIGSSNQVQNAFDKNGVQAGLLLLKPIRLPHNGQNNGIQTQAFNQRAQANNFAPQPFGFQAAKQNQALSLAYGGQDARFPIQDNSYLTRNVQNPIVGQLPAVNNEFQNLAYSLGNQINGQAFGQQLGGFPVPALSQEHFGDQFHSASDSREHVVEQSHQNFFSDEMPFKKETSNKKPEKLTSSFFTPTVSTTDEDEFLEENESNVRSVVHEREISTAARETDIVPLKYPNDSSPEDQARLKQTVQRFFNMLQSRQ
ncbi:uncharacterized protein LOC126836001 isoform X2 [Adelges cooleyi]|nr:uncharacterized protein LOC126836001 isoform X2 [Adelges cooleyi]